jgi:hypothetical protein
VEAGEEDQGGEGAAGGEEHVLLGICFWRAVPETAVGPDRRAGKGGVRGERGRMRCCGASVDGVLA